MTQRITIEDIIKATSAKFSGSDTSVVITGINTLSAASNTELTFLANDTYRDQMLTTKAAVIIIRPEDADKCPVASLVVDNPYLAYAKVCKLFSTKATVKNNNANFFIKIAKGFFKKPTKIHSSVVIGDNCKIPDSVMLATNVVIGDNVTLGENVKIYPNCVIGNNCTIGENSELKANVIFYDGVQVGEACLFHSGCVIGSDGFGNANDKGIWYKIPHLGTVIIGNDVEIGANTTIDRGALKNTIIEDNVRIDNLVQIAHNVQIGAHTAIASCVGIAGSTTIGKYCMIGGAAAINGHISICDGVVLSALAMVTKSITEPGIYSSGTGFFPRKEWQRLVVRFRQLEELNDRVKSLEDKTS